ncbi:MAG: site-2 protease family protein [Candidatus Sericytochromatia bacterium]|nr:site-2 protease family protein [Candidatus Sericytochromatia bacterium]
MIFRSNPLDLLILIPLFIISITMHEAAHAYAAYAFGDDTAAKEGRLTLNPLAHLDPLGAIMVLLVGFGWAKPVPVDPRNLRNPNWQMPAVAAAGPLANLFLAILSIVLLILSTHTGQSFFAEPLFLSASLNLLLMLFNLVPLPPLDGAGILRGFLPRPWQFKLDELGAYGPVILIVLVFVPGVKEVFFGTLYGMAKFIFEFLMGIFAFLG